MAGDKNEGETRTGSEVTVKDRAAGFAAAVNGLAFFCGLYMSVVGCVLIYEAANGHLEFTGDKLGDWITIIYSTIMGMLVLASTMRLKFILRSFAFASHLFGKGLLCLFVGTYYLNVTSGGLSLAMDTFNSEGSAAFSIDSASKIQRDQLLTVIAGSVTMWAGLLFILLHLCPCHVGCCSDGQQDVGYSISDMQNTAIKKSQVLGQAGRLDKLLRLLTFLVGGLLCFSCHFIWESHFEGCVPVSEEDVTEYSCQPLAKDELDEFTAVYLFDALYAGFFGATIIFAGLEWKVFIKHFGFLSTPLGKFLWFCFVGIYYMGAGSDLSWNTFSQLFDRPWHDQMPFIAGVSLLGLATLYGLLGICPCLGGCCSDGDGGGGKSKGKNESEFDNPAHGDEKGGDELI